MASDGTFAGQWAEGCNSAVSQRGHARYYAFTLTQPSEVTITLESAADPYLYLRQGQAREGDFLYENDDHRGSFAVSRIQTTLAAGTYTIEATTYHRRVPAGSFTLTVSGLDATPPPSCSVGQTLAPGDSCRHWDFTIQVAATGTLRLRFTGDRVDAEEPTLIRRGNTWRIESLP